MPSAFVRVFAMIILALLTACAWVGCGSISTVREGNTYADWSSNGVMPDFSEFLLRGLGPPGVRRETVRRLVLRKGDDLNSIRHLLSRLRPIQLEAEECTSVDLDALKGITSLREITLRSCPALQNLDGIRGLTGLRWLSLGKCSSLKNVDGIKGLTGLKSLGIEGCPDLRDLDFLAQLTSLDFLAITDCRSLQNVDGIKGLTGLKTILLRGCNKLSSTTLRDMRVALPDAKIVLPDNTFAHR